MSKVTVQGRQGGMTYLGMLILMVVIAFFAIVVVKVLPVYLENFKVNSSLKSLAQEPKDDLAAMTPGEIERQLLNRLDINDVDHVTKDDITISRQGGRTVVEVSYEARVPLFLNIDIVARFPDNRVELGGP